MWPWNDASNWIDIIDNGLALIGILFAITLPSWFSVRSHREIKAVKRHVANGHTTPLRVDLDKAMMDIAEVKDRHDFHGDILKQLREDLRLEREERRNTVSEIRADLHGHRLEMSEKMADLIFQINRSRKHDQ